MALKFIQVHILKSEIPIGDKKNVHAVNSAAEKKHRKFFPLIKSSRTSTEKSEEKEQACENSKSESNAKNPMVSSSSMFSLQLTLVNMAAQYLSVKVLCDYNVTLHIQCLRIFYVTFVHITM